MKARMELDWYLPSRGDNVTDYMLHSGPLLNGHAAARRTFPILKVPHVHLDLPLSQLARLRSSSPSRP
jgi:hypothetical protein